MLVALVLLLTRESTEIEQVVDATLEGPVQATVDAADPTPPLAPVTSSLGFSLSTCRSSES